MTKQVLITIRSDELLYDIANETFLRGRSILTDDNYKNVAAIYATADDGNVDKIMRGIRRGLMDLRSTSSEYVNDGNLWANNSLIGMSRDIILTLDMPLNFDESMSGSIAEAVHGYLADRAISEWYLAVAPEQMEPYTILAKERLDAFREAIAGRNRPSRPPMRKPPRT